MNPYPSYKDSGIEWVGKIPSKWDVYPMKYGLTMITGKEHPKKDDIKISPENIESDTGVCLNLYSDYSGEGVPFSKGDILLNKLRLYLKKILFTEYDGFSMGEMIVLRTRDNLFNKYLFYILFNQGLIDLLDSQSNGVKLPRVSPEVILNTSFLYPNKEQQIQISNYLDHKTQQIDSLIEKTLQKIELLKEQRASLINQVVTKGLNPDVEMKDSGVEWIGMIPSGWITPKLNYIVHKITDGEHITPNFTDSGVPFLSSKDVIETGICINVNKFISIEDSIKMRKRCDPEFGDVLVVGRGNSIGRVSIVDTNEIFCLLGSVILIKQRNNVNNRYLFYYLSSSKVFEELINTSSHSVQPTIYLEGIKRLPIILPSIKEQQQIVKYLNEKIEKIDSFIEKETQRIDLLKEYRKSLISSVVTGKIDVRDEVFV